MSVITPASLLFFTSLFLVSCGGGEPTDDSNNNSSATNTAPVLQKVEEQYSANSTSKTIALSATDAENDVLIYEAMTPEPNVSLVLTGNTLTISPVSNWSGTSTITITVFDGVLSDADTFTFTILEVTTPPTVASNNSSISTPPPIPLF